MLAVWRSTTLEYCSTILSVCVCVLERCLFLRKSTRKVFVMRGEREVEESKSQRNDLGKVRKDKRRICPSLKEGQQLQEEGGSEIGVPFLASTNRI